MLKHHPVEMTPSETRAAMERLELRPSRAMGQNFLTDGNVSRLIVRAAEVSPDDTVLEIGPGLGALTEVLVEEAGRVVAVEKDDRLAPFLKERFATKANIQIEHADALEFDLASVAASVQDMHRFKVVANLPYSISTALLTRLVEMPSRPSRMVLMVQREVGERLAAKPHSKDYGAMTLFTQLYYEVRREHLVSARCFIPAPEVESAVIILWLNPHPLLEPALEVPFKQLVRTAFGQRRKMLRGVLPKSELGEWVTSDRLTAALQGVGVAETARAEELSLAQWLQLTRILVSCSQAQRSN